MNRDRVHSSISCDWRQGRENVYPESGSLRGTPSANRTPFSHDTRMNSVSSSSFSASQNITPRSMKPLTCYFWYRGNCKWSDSECLYSHHNTGHIANGPLHREEGRPAVAGRNATQPRPVYQDWRNLRAAQQEKPDIQHQINDITNKTQASGRKPFQLAPTHPELDHQHHSFRSEASPAHRFTMNPRGFENNTPLNPSDSRQLHSDQSIHSPSVSQTSRADAYNQAMPQQQPSLPSQMGSRNQSVPQPSVPPPYEVGSSQQAHSQQSPSVHRAPRDPSTGILPWGDHPANVTQYNFSPSRQAPATGMTDVKDAVIRDLARRLDDAIAQLAITSSDSIHELRRVTQCIDALPVEPSRPVSPNAISPPYGSIPTSTERILIATERLLHIAKSAAMLSYQLDEEKLLFSDRLASIGKGDLIPQGWATQERRQANGSRPA